MTKVKNRLINWEYQKKQLREKYRILTDKDLDFKQGKMEDMIKKLQEKLGKTRHQIYKIFANL